MTPKKLSAILIVSAIFFGATLAQAATYKTKLSLSVASANPSYDEAYVLTVPADTPITASGWKSLGNITASHATDSRDAFDPSKKLVVTVTTSNDFKLVASGITGTVSYSVMSGDNAESATVATKFEFKAAEINKNGGTSKPIGVSVTDWSGLNLSAGDYVDEIIYTVSVESAATTKTVTWAATDSWEVTQVGRTPTMTKDGVTLSGGTFDTDQHNIMGGGTFSVASGNFTKIEVTAPSGSPSGDGWSVSEGVFPPVATWTGKAASVSFSNSIMDGGIGLLKIVFTIEE